MAGTKPVTTTATRPRRPADGGGGGGSGGPRRTPPQPDPLFFGGCAPPRYKHGTFEVLGPGGDRTYTIATRLKKADLRPPAATSTHRRIKPSVGLPIQDLTPCPIMERYVASPTEPLPRSFEQARERGTNRVYVQNLVVSVTLMAEGIPTGPLDLHRIALHMPECSVNCRSFSAIHVIMGDRLDIQSVACIDADRDVIRGGTPATQGCTYVMKACTTIMMFSTGEIVATGNNCFTAIHTDVHAFTARMQEVLRVVYANPAVRAYPSNYSVQNCVASAYIGAPVNLQALCAQRSATADYNETFPNARLSLRYTDPDMPVFESYRVRDFMRNGELNVKVILSLHGCALITGAPHPIAVAWVWYHMHALLQPYLVAPGATTHRPKNVVRRTLLEELDALVAAADDDGSAVDAEGGGGAAASTAGAETRNLILENFIAGAAVAARPALDPLFD